MGKYTKYLHDLPGGKKKCTLCQHEFNRQKDSNTNVFAYHLKHKHPKEWRKMNGQRAAEEEDEAPPVKKACVSQSTIQECFLENDHSKNSQIHRSIMQLVSAAALPLSFVDSSAWKNFCRIALPKFTCKSRHHFSRTELPQLYLEYQRKIKEELKQVSNVSMGFDGWTDASNKHQYLGVIVYFIADSALCFRVIGVVDISVERHTGQFLMEKLQENMKEYGIEKKLCAIVRDGASNVKNASELIGVPHFDCFAHKLNLAVKEGIASFKSLNNTLGKLRKIANIVNKSANMRREFKEVSSTLDVPALSLKKHIEVRWNTVHAVFERSLKVKDTIEFLSNEHSEWPKFTDNDWSTVETVVKILQPIVDATLMIQNRGMTSSAIIPLCVVLINELGRISKFRTFCSAMSEKLNEELRKYNEIEYLQFGMMLDVRFKGDYAEDEWKQRLLEKLYSVSDVAVEEEEEVLEQTARPQSDNPFSRFMREKTPDIARKPLSTQAEQLQLEHQMWFRENTDIDDNPIEFWEKSNNQKTFPNLYRLSSLYLSTPATTAEAERLFSSARTILTDNRKLLSSENFEKLLFLQQNIKLMDFNSNPTSHVLSPETPVFPLQTVTPAELIGMQADGVEQAQPLIQLLQLQLENLRQQHSEELKARDAIHNERMQRMQLELEEGNNRHVEQLKQCDDEGAEMRTAVRYLSRHLSYNCKCVVCLSTMTDSTSMSCGHSTCYRCIVTSMADEYSQTETQRRPVCRTRITSIIPSLVLKDFCDLQKTLE